MRFAGTLALLENPKVKGHRPGRVCSCRRRSASVRMDSSSSGDMSSGICAPPAGPICSMAACTGHVGAEMAHKSFHKPMLPRRSATNACWGRGGGAAGKLPFPVMDYRPICSLAASTGHATSTMPDSCKNPLSQNPFSLTKKGNQLQVGEAVEQLVLL